MANKPITEFIEKYYLHFNAASLVDASKGYVAHLKDGGKMLITASARCEATQAITPLAQACSLCSRKIKSWKLYLSRYELKARTI